MLPKNADESKLAQTLGKIIMVMRDKTLPDDVALSEIQDWLTIGGYDVPLRSYDYRDAPGALRDLVDALDRAGDVDGVSMADWIDGPDGEYVGGAVTRARATLKHDSVVYTKLWIVEGIADLGYGERRRMKFGVIATNEQAAINKVLRLIRKEIGKPHNWVLEQTEVRQIPGDICHVVGLEGFGEGA